MLGLVLLVLLVLLAESLISNLSVKLLESNML